MDLSKFKTSDWLKVGGGVAMLVAGFLKWWGPDCKGVGECEAAVDSLGLNASAFDLTFTGLFPWLFVVAIGVLAFLAAAGIFKLPGSLPWPIIFLAVAALSFLLVLIRVIFDPYDSAFGADSFSRGIGLYLALIAAGASAAGSFLGFKESGGDIGDLTDMNKLKGQFGGGAAGGGAAGGGTPPPPPPPGMTPPPPPPPPMG